MNRFKKIVKTFADITKRLLTSAARITLLSAIILFTLFPLGPSTESYDTKRIHVPYEIHDFPFESFVFMSVDVAVTSEGIPVGELSTTASGVVVQTMDDSRTYILTAGHVCDPTVGLPSMYSVFDQEVRLTAYDYYGFPHESVVVAVDEEHDLCLLTSEEKWTTGSPVANNSPITGEKVYSISAPHSIYSPGNALLFDGYYTGLDPVMNAFYTIPTKPGSSGAGIFNNRGQIVGIVHSAPADFENVSIASSLEQVKMFSYENVNIVVTF